MTLVHSFDLWFTSNLNLQFIPNNTHFSRQGWDNYTSTSLIDGFYTNTPHLSFTCTTNTSSTHNLEHFPIILHTHPDLLIYKATGKPPTNHTPRLHNPIMEVTLQALNAKFNQNCPKWLLKFHQHTNIYRIPAPKKCGNMPNWNYINSLRPSWNALKPHALKNHHNPHWLHQIPRRFPTHEITKTMENHQNNQTNTPSKLATTLGCLMNLHASRTYNPPCHYTHHISVHGSASPKKLKPKPSQIQLNIPKSIVKKNYKKTIIKYQSTFNSKPK